jgi:exodeoxyribonuclease (lambda-induced)
MEVVTEEMLDHSNLFSNDYTDWGNDHEAQAVEEYEIKTGKFTETCGYVPYNDHCGGSPDRLVDSDGILEVKCPYNPTNHLKYMLIKDQESFKKQYPNYYWQIHMNLLATGRKWCHFVSFNPRNEDFRLYILLIQRNEQDIELLISAVEKAVKYKKEIIAELQLTDL